MEGSQGDNITMSVHTGRLPAPAIAWFKDEEPIVSNSHLEIIDEPETCKLVVTNVTPADSGTYKCVATSIIGTITKKFLLNIEGKLRLTALRVAFPAFRKFEKEYQVKVMTLQCDDGYVETRLCRAFSTIFRPTSCLNAQSFFPSPAHNFWFPHHRKDGFVLGGMKPARGLLLLQRFQVLSSLKRI